MTASTYFGNIFTIFVWLFDLLDVSKMDHMAYIFLERRRSIVGVGHVRSKLALRRLATYDDREGARFERSRSYAC